MLKEAIASVLNQTFSDFEILVVDNASPDETAGIVQEFRDPRIRYHRHPKNIGPQLNWRFALTEPRTRYVALLEDDNTFLPHHLESAVRALEAHGEATFYGCACETFGDCIPEVLRPDWIPRCDSVSICPGSSHAVHVLKGTPIASSTWVMRQEAISAIHDWGGLNWPASMDWLWQGQMFLAGALAFHGQIGAKYRWHKSNYARSWMASGQSSVEVRHTMRALAHIAERRGFIARQQFIEEVVKWPAPVAASLVVALAGADSSPELRSIAFEIFRRHPRIRSAESSRHARIAACVGSWYLRYADRLHRWRCHWPPKDAP